MTSRPIVWSAGNHRSTEWPSTDAGAFPNGEPASWVVDPRLGSSWMSAVDGTGWASTRDPRPRKRHANQSALNGKVAVVTGGGSGIGRATALLLAKHGARVHVADLRGDTARETARAIEAANGSAMAHTLDVADPDAVEALAETVFAAEGHVDILHNNAG